MSRTQVPRAQFKSLKTNPTTTLPHPQRWITTFTATHTRSVVRMLYLVGLGLADEKDITVKGLEIVKKAERVYLEAYTAVLLVEKEVLVSISNANLVQGAFWLTDVAATVGSLLWLPRNHRRPRTGRIVQRRHPQRCR